MNPVRFDAYKAEVDAAFPGIGGEGLKLEIVSSP